MSNKEIYEKYKTANLIPFSLKITEKDNKKILSNIPNFTTILNYSKANIDKRASGLAIRTGTAYKKTGLFIVGVDIDNKPDDEQYKNGLTKWTELMMNNKFSSITAINTPIQQTGNNGYHYLFLVNEEQLQIIGCSLTGLYIEGVKYSIDIKATNQFLLCEPTKYKNKSYNWIKAPDDNDILKMPNWLYDIIISNKEKPKAIKIIKEVIEEKQEPINDIIINSNDDIAIKLINCLDSKRFDNYNDWIKLGAVFKFLNISFDVFNNYSKLSSKYNEAETIKLWSNVKNKNLNYLYTLKYYAKTDNATLYNEIINEDNIKNLDINDKYNKIEFSKQYLLDKDSKLNNKADIVETNINKFITNENIKTLSILSPYGTGKSQLLHKIFEKKEYKRVLWISYRITLTDDISGNFKEFSSYLDHKYRDDKLIIQLESLLNLDTDIFDDGIVPTYDLIIMDEVESILNQFNSPTFKGNSKNIYEFLDKILKSSKQIIALDGDMNNRALEYLTPYGEMIFLKNTYHINPKVFNITQNKDYFLDDVFKSVDTAIADKKAICFCCMNKGEDIYNKLLEYKSDLRILIINSDTGDDIKLLLKDINTHILNYDILIYSPSIEAGVNIDIENYFNKLYCILSSGSTSQRAFLQMTARVRHLSDYNILTLNECFKLNSTTNFWNFDEVKNGLLYSKNINLNTTYNKLENGTYQKIDKHEEYDINYIYNKTELLNKNSYYFLHLFKILCERKGMTFNILEDNNKTKSKIDKTLYFNNIVKTELLGDLECSVIKKKVNIREATATDKLKIKKHILCKQLGVHMLDVEILESWYSKINNIKKYISLIDTENIKDTNENNTTDARAKVNIINSVINTLGYTSIFDKTNISAETFDENITNLIKTNDVYLKPLYIKQLFNISKCSLDKISHKAVIGYVNQLINPYMISIVSCRVYKDDGYKYSYKLKHLNNITEIIKHKIDNGFNLIDKNNIFKCDESTFIYNHLVKKKCGISNCDNSINFDLLDKDIFKFDIDFDDF